MKLDTIITLVAVVLIFLSLILFSGYYLFNQTNICVSDPLSYAFLDEADMIKDFLNNDNLDLKICSFKKDDMLPYICIDMSNRKT